MIRFFYIVILFIYPLLCDAQGQISRPRHIPPKSTKKTYGSIDGLGWVDLDLSSGTKWATCNVFTGPNGNKLILPKTGYKDWKELKNINESHYWMREVHFKDDETVAKIASSYRFPNEGKYSAYQQWTCLGMCVRPVISWYNDKK